MKTSIKIALSLSLLASSLYADFAVVDRWSTTLRNNPSTDSKVVSYAKMGRAFEIHNTVGNWIELSNGTFVDSATVRVVDNLDDINLRVIINKANIRSRPVATKKYLVRKDVLGTRLKANALLSNGWYALSDGNLVFANATIEIPNTEYSPNPVLKEKKIKESDTKMITVSPDTNNTKEAVILLNASLNEDNSTKTKMVAPTTKQDDYIKHSFKKEIQRTLKNLIIETLNLKDKLTKADAKSKKLSLKIKELSKSYITVKKNNNDEKLFITKENLLVKEKPSLTSKVVSSVEKNGIVEVVKVKEGRALLTIGGYVSTKYLETLSNKIRYLDDMKTNIEILHNTIGRLSQEIKTKTSKKEVSRMIKDGNKILNKKVDELKDSIFKRNSSIDNRILRLEEQSKGNLTLSDVKQLLNDRVDSLKSSDQTHNQTKEIEDLKRQLEDLKSNLALYVKLIRAKRGE